MKPTKSEVISILNNLVSCMNTSAIVLKRYGRKDKASELDGASLMVKEWVISLLVKPTKRTTQDKRSEQIGTATKEVMNQYKETLKGLEDK